MTSFYQSIDDQIAKTLIDPDNFARYHTHKPKGGEPANVLKVMNLNNEKYEFFRKNILNKHIDKDGKIICEKAVSLWMVYEDSLEIIKYHKSFSLLRPSNPKIAREWVRIFEESSIEDLYKNYGVNVVSTAYGIVLDYLREWMVQEKYERIYSKSNNYEEWYKLAMENKNLLEGREVPFNLQTVGDKAKAIINVRN